MSIVKFFDLNGQGRKEAWKLYDTEMVNCGNRKCRLGCVDRNTGVIIPENKPHGPYSRLYRYRDGRVYQVRIGSFTPSERQMNILKRLLGGNINGLLARLEDGEYTEADNLRFLIYSAWRLHYAPEELIGVDRNGQLEERYKKKVARLDVV